MTIDFLKSIIYSEVERFTTIGLYYFVFCSMAFSFLVSSVASSPRLVSLKLFTASFINSDLPS